MTHLTPVTYPGLTPCLSWTPQQLIADSCYQIPENTLKGLNPYAAVEYDSALKN